MILYGKKNCPNCMIAEKYLTDKGVEFEKVLFEDNPDLAYKYNVTNVPILILDNGTTLRTVQAIKEMFKDK